MISSFRAALYNKVDMIKMLMGHVSCGLRPLDLLSNQLINISSHMVNPSQWFLNFHILREATKRFWTEGL